MLKRILWIAAGLLVLFFTSCNEQDFSDQKLSCEDSDIKLYNDSLKALSLRHRTSQIIHLTDSLIGPLNNNQCIEMVEIQCSRALAFEFQFNFEKTIEIYSNVLPVAQENDFLEQEVFIHLGMARAYEVISRKEQAFEHLETAKQLIDKHDLIHLLSGYHVRYASHLRVFDRDLEKARFHASRGLELAIEYDNPRPLTDGYMLLGFLTSDFDESIGYTEKCIEHLYEQGDFVGATFQ
ncbi:MAG: hypothetical protein AAF193_03045, partial [Bacteroidota bacterium]